MFTLSTLFSNPPAFIVGFIALAVSIGVHEFSHVLSAYLQGDQTGKALGRLTLNPLRHLDPWGTIAIVVAGIGWGRPAPYNPYNLRSRRWGPLLVAIAGPISNLIIATAAGYFLLYAGAGLPKGNLLLLFLQTLVMLNAALAVFNLIPISPLDGSHILEAWLGPENPLVRTLRQYGMFLLLFLLVLGGGLLSAYIVGGISLVLRAVGLGALL
ncbi:MAG: site-2 protease family protein [Patescibacteria group bacterium]